jgi:RNA polymerase sigma-70 factor (ECF subfamily)
VAAQAKTVQLVVRAQEGDEDAFTELVAHHERRILSYFLARTPSVAAAEDLAQETFVRAFTALPGLDAPARFLPWLFGIARNAYREWARSSKRHAKPPAPLPGDEPPLVDRKVSLHKAIFEIVHDLPDPYKEVLVLRYFEGAATPTIATSLDRPLGTVTKQISRGHALVAERIKALKGHTTMLRFMLPKQATSRG